MAKKRRTAEQIALEKRVKNDIYKDRAKKLRATGAFGDLFTAKRSGIDLRKSPDQWPAAAKARVTKYARELGTLIAGQNKAKRYYRKDHLKQAVHASGQENILPGQRAAIFAIDRPDERIEITFTKKHRIKTVRRDSLEEIIRDLDRTAMIADPKKAVADLLDKMPGNWFKFKHGKNRSSATYTRSQMLDRISFLVTRYSGENIDEFVTGIYAFPTITSREAKRRDLIHSKEVEQRRIERYRRLGAERRAYTKAEQKSIKMTGRAGRLK